MSDTPNQATSAMVLAGMLVLAEKCVQPGPSGGTQYFVSTSVAGLKALVEEVYAAMEQAR